MVMALIAFHSVSEHHMIEMHYNIVLAMPLAAYASMNSKEQDVSKEHIVMAP
jgi:hypothetical protein